MDQAVEEFLYPLSWAAASSLPEDEGLQHVIEKLKSIGEKELPTAAFISLISLHSFSRSLGKAGSRKLSSLG
ncbi:hypothetical protein MH116_03380 [Bacillus pumilus]|uniref:hypothetical protein n=1 Tax=Bacillus pumilus TaxID=1408 RepID=UPI000AAE5FCD|nr:hypothetical protein [Bacillus pumilus]MCY7616910.1 hypothetical protein [Bacillus pumilus]